VDNFTLPAAKKSPCGDFFAALTSFKISMKF